MSAQQGMERRTKVVTLIRRKRAFSIKEQTQVLYIPAQIEEEKWTCTGHVEWRTGSVPSMQRLINLISKKLLLSQSEYRVLFRFWRCCSLSLLIQSRGAWEARVTCARQAIQSDFLKRESWVTYDLSWLVLLTLLSQICHRICWKLSNGSLKIFWINR